MLEKMQRLKNQKMHARRNPEQNSTDTQSRENMPQGVSVLVKTPDAVAVENAENAGGEQKMEEHASLDARTATEMDEEAGLRLHESIGEVLVCSSNVL